MRNYRLSHLRHSPAGTATTVYVQLNICLEIFIISSPKPLLFLPTDSYEVVAFKQLCIVALPKQTSERFLKGNIVVRFIFYTFV